MAQRDLRPGHPFNLEISDNCAPPLLKPRDTLRVLHVTKKLPDHANGPDLDSTVVYQDWCGLVR